MGRARVSVISLFGKGGMVAYQIRQAKEIPHSQGEPGPIGQHPPLCNSLRVFGTTRAQSGV